MAKKKILLIDDEVALTKIFKSGLEDKLAVEVDVANSGQEGINKAVASDYAIVITDLEMPEINGEKVIEEIKKAKPKQKLALYSIYHDNHQMLPEGLRAKVDIILPKPIDPQSLKKALRRKI